MQNPRVYGREPYGVVVIHGGPGAPGEMAPVARELADGWGVLEPLQTKASVNEQVEELRDMLEAHAELPAILVGYSWGAWLSLFCAARHAALVKKLILISSAPFTEEHAAAILPTQLSRLSEDERRDVASMMEAMKDPAIRDKDALLARFGTLFARADACHPATLDVECLDISWQIHQNVWKEAAQWRSSGKLLRLVRKIRCPVVAIHGACDPHPADGVRVPLSATLSDFRFVLLDHCGHKPWIERQATQAFYDLLRRELP